MFGCCFVVGLFAIKESPSVIACEFEILTQLMCMIATKAKP